MFRVVETTHHGDFHKTVSAAATTTRSALYEVLGKSPYNKKLRDRWTQFDQLSKALVDTNKGKHGWATYTNEYVPDLAGYGIRYNEGNGGEFAVVVHDAGDTLLVHKIHETRTFNVKAVHVTDFGAPKKSEEEH